MEIVDSDVNNVCTVGTVSELRPRAVRQDAPLWDLEDAFYLLALVKFVVVTVRPVHVVLKQLLTWNIGSRGV